MASPKLLLVGAGGHARACADVIERAGQYEIAGLVGTPAEKGQVRFGYRVIATDHDLQSLLQECRYAFIAVGQIKSPSLRIRLFQQAVELGYVLPSVVAPTAYVAPSATIGQGTIVMHGAIVNSGASIGTNCIINSRALIEHDALVSDHCHIATGAIANGNVRIGAGTFVGSGSVIKESIAIGDYCVVGMGSLVRADLANNSEAHSH